MQITQTWKIGDCIDSMQETEPDSVDLIVTDPPYFMVNKSGSGFMGKSWDSMSSEATAHLTKTQMMYQMIREFHVNWMSAAIRVLKPGAFAFIMSSPRQDVLAQMMCAAAESGFETGFTSIYHVFASGFPKAANIGKMVDKRFGAEREVVGTSNKQPSGYIRHGRTDEEVFNGTDVKRIPENITVPSTPEAKSLDGSYGGFQPKPAVEVIMVVMKPLSEKTYVEQALCNQKGVTWLDGGRIPYQSDRDIWQSNRSSDDWEGGEFKSRNRHSAPHGRFPANLLVSDDVLADGTTTKATIDKHLYEGETSSWFAKEHSRISRGDFGSFSRYFSLDAWWDGRIKHLPKEAQKTFPFMIVPKANKSEKGDTCKHPTVKPVKLFSWLITVGSREGDTVLDPFLGSGTTLAACRRTNRRCIGFEIDPQWENLYVDRCMADTPPLSTYF